MISNEDFKKLCEIDEKMLNNKIVTTEELQERTRIIKEFNREIDKAYLKNSKII